jgi:hypothetical protein
VAKTVAVPGDGYPGTGANEYELHTRAAILPGAVATGALPTPLNRDGN